MLRFPKATEGELVVANHKFQAIPFQNLRCKGAVEASNFYEFFLKIYLLVNLFCCNFKTKTQISLSDFSLKDMVSATHCNSRNSYAFDLVKHWQKLLRARQKL